MKKIILMMMLSASVVFANGIIVKQSNNSVDATVAKLKNIILKNNLNVFSIINHKQNAKKADLKMQESCVIIFGTPKVGTPLMNDNPLSALDLPLKILVYKDKDSKVKVAYRDGAWLKQEHSLNVDKYTNKMIKALNNITNKAIK